MIMIVKIPGSQIVGNGVHGHSVNLGVSHSRYSWGAWPAEGLQPRSRRAPQESDQSPHGFILFSLFFLALIF